MGELVFDCIDSRAERYAAAPILTLVLRVAETTGAQVGAIGLRCQMRIQPVRRTYDEGEAERLNDLFGTPDRWGDTLKPLQFATVSALVPAFRNSIEIELPVPCSYDLEVASTRYFDALAGGDVPLLLLFSGTVFLQGPAGMQVEQVPWHKECNYRLPVRVWRETMDYHFPNSAWLRLHRDTLAALARFKSERTLATWEETLQVLLAEAGEVVR
ncbi:DUF6084 family protein [Planosporangium mesophilum]|uniref:Uncharacterized protein n=1 Tax=Planosporangium mesophilum TaxID=689768 RepID=A0A8J3X1G4_9ACTN|nr:DUF6084 family protein [Planosporangium mesophilum]NJC82749.1 hypothetical protein [Planosporangium mesophilum]GII23781.1 hypothetical protein Pme01_33780 [Planosporangium mesophilum]